MSEDIDAYVTPGAMTRIVERDALGALPSDLAGIAAVTQGVIIHEFWSQAYGVVLTPDRLDDLNQRSVMQMIERMLQLDPRPLTEARPPARRMVGNCRFFSTFACALLRRAGIPARARCGFGAYFEPGKFVDHWIVEHWDGTRWVRSDIQIDELQRNALRLPFDPLDTPTGQFLTGGEAWERCRRGDADPAQFGILDMWGLWFVRGNAIRDLASLNHVETLPWDGWGVMDETDTKDLAPDHPVNLLVDELAAVTARDDRAEIVAFYESNEGLQVPAEVFDHRLGVDASLPQ